MCEFCHKHGDGRKWYLQAKNYGEDLMSDLRRQRIIRDMLLNTKTIESDCRLLERIERAPTFVQRCVKGYMSRRLKRDHFGQVVPIEDIEEIFGFVNSIVQVPCLCRFLSTGEEAGYCYGIALGPNGDQFGAIGYSALNKKAFIDQRACYGCGVCRSACRHDAIKLRPRSEVPVAANIW